MFFSVLVFCTGTDVGLGFDGSSYEYPTVDDQLPDGATGKVTRITIRQKPEGKICRRPAEKSHDNSKEWTSQRDDWGSRGSHPQILSFNELL